MRTVGIFFAAVAVSAAATGCSAKTDNNEGKNTLGIVRATLRRAASCSDLEQSLKADALQKMNKAIDAQIRSIQKYGYGGGYGYATAGGAKGAPEAASAPSPQTNASADDSAGASRAGSYSETNKQVANVDEADFVKTDGKYIYLLHGQKLEILNAFPATALAEATNVDIEGEPTEMFQWDGKIVVYSTVNGAPIYDKAGIKPRANFQDYAYGGRGGVAVDIAVAPGGYYPGYIANPLTKITVIDMQGTSPSVSREVYFEGNYLSSRRIDKQVRTVLQGAAPGPQLKMYPETPPSVQSAYENGTYSQAQEAQYKQAWINAYEQLRAENTAKINGSTVTDWVPYTFSKTAAGIDATSLKCEDFYLPTPGSTQYGLTTVETLDANDASSTLKSAAIVGQADTVYSNEKTMVLAARAWLAPEIVEAIEAVTGGTISGGGGGVVSSPPMAGSGGSAPTPVSPAPDIGTRNLDPLTSLLPSTPTPIAMTSTHLHKFDIGADPTSALYVASGTVPGNIKDQFSIDERAGFIRVSTTEQRGYIVQQGATMPSNLPRTANHVYALEEKSGGLDIAGTAGDLAPGETVFSTRFVGDNGYVVTYLQKDPLFVIDMKNPRALRVAGQLTIPGFSSYMHPIDDNHLLTIGRDEGLALQIFDVTDPANPKQAHKFVFTNDYGYSEAENNHKAFTYFADKKLLAFPFMAYGSSSMKSTLELFKVDVSSGISRVGGVDHTAFFSSTTGASRGYCGGYFEPMVRRGVFLDDVVYSISYGGVIASDAASLNQIASFTLPQPQLASYPGCAEPATGK